MSIEENKAIVRRLVEALNARDLVALDEIATPEMAQYFKKRMIPSVYGISEDYHMEISEMIGEGDTVGARLATSGTHTGEWMGITPTGTKWTNTSVYFLRITNEKIAEMTGVTDFLSHLQQLGATIMPPNN